MEGCQIETWRGSIPVTIELAADELVGMRAPRPFYAMIPRNSYLPVLAEELAMHFGDFTAQLSYGFPTTAVKRVEESATGISSEEEQVASRWVPVWFSCEEVTLRWHYPAGVSYDALGKGKLPWQLVVHFSKFSDNSLALRQPDTCERTFFHALKQAVHLETGTARLALSMPRVQQTALWKAISIGDRDKFNANDVAKSESPLEAPPKSVPVRLISSYDAPFIQLPHAAYDASGRKKTLRETLLNTKRLAFVTPNSTLTAQGILLNPDMPLIDAWKALRHADHFLYVLLSHCTQRPQRRASASASWDAESRLNTSCKPIDPAPNSINKDPPLPAADCALSNVTASPPAGELLMRLPSGKKNSA